ncbi:glycoside hydrolase family 18 protein [Mycena leptocephala]|nr:glycoside hydrolase family 18 protein [Mycena leptocephala]
MTLVAALIYICVVLRVFGFDNTRSDNANRDNSYGAAFPTDAAGSQKDLGAYCQDSNVNAIPIAFVDVFFGSGGVPVINLANSCDNGTFPGTELLDCSGMSGQIQSCQQNDILVTISLGGGNSEVGFTSDIEAEDFAETIWNTFLGGESDTRPFGSAVLDGVDLDIEQGPPLGYAAFVSRIEELSSNSTRKYYISAAPQCQFPDAYVGQALNTVAFDMVYGITSHDRLPEFIQPCFQFYNNAECGIGTSNFNFNQWDAWAKNQSQNPDVKVYIGAAASESAAESGYVNGSVLEEVATQTQRAFTSFGGVMFWDMSQAYANGDYHVGVKMALNSDGASTMEPVCAA